jgi:hypothetical protein
MRDRKGALKDLNTAARLDPDYETAVYNLGVTSAAYEAEDLFPSSPPQ